jgi:hypothetical protein
MKRVVLVILALAAFAPFAGGSAGAAVPCRDRIYNDWYADGKIATTYPIACYKDALSHIRADAATYSSLADDIRSAMQGALARMHGRKSVPAQIGKGGQGAVQPAMIKLRTKPTKSTRQQPPITTPGTETSASGQTNGDSGGGVPTPILILGGLALLLAALGAAGAAAKRFRRPPTA